MGAMNQVFANNNAHPIESMRETSRVAVFQIISRLYISKVLLYAR